MISVIMPLGQRHRPSAFWLARGALYITAAGAGGALVGAVLGLAGALIRPVVPGLVLFAAITVLAVAYGLHEAGLWRLPHPERAWLVPNEWIVRRPLLGAAAFGMVLGAGVFTFIPFTSFYLLLAWEALTANPAAGALLGAAYGLARGLPVLTGALVPLRGGTVVALHLSVLRAGPRLHRATGGLLLVLAVLLGIPFLLHLPFVP